MKLKSAYENLAKLKAEKWQSPDGSVMVSLAEQGGFLVRCSGKSMTICSKDLEQLTLLLKQYFK